MEDRESSSECALGRKEFWDDFYSKELENFHTFGDVGDIWFGKKNVDRIVNWLLQNEVGKKSSILDVGCGNGYTLICLGKHGFEDLAGIDYVENAILLARNVAKENNIKVKLEAADFLQPSSSSNILNHTYDIIIDKGTFDAVSLNPNENESKKKQFCKQVNHLLSQDGYFLLFSCNWTKEELLNIFKDFFSLYDEIEIPSIGFGGKTGQTVTAIILRKLSQKSSAEKS
ncbi:EEF1A lysine methyltransferase 2-like [Uloborus diversus]|uniref:EEF1A lysine methyltransferase 2-like n=1 Tax=Uloborus diversus TaxID=327109 RepID=UPI0024097960|nr:EEF1A lysine methyltransferase 2-like [Uloborus diversus]